MANVRLPELPIAPPTPVPPKPVPDRLVVKLDSVMADPGPVRLTVLLGRFKVNAVLGVPARTTLEAVPALVATRVTPPEAARGEPEGEMVTVPVEAPAAKVPKFRALAEEIVSGVTTVAEAVTLVAGVVDCAAAGFAESTTASASGRAARAHFRSMRDDSLGDGFIAFTSTFYT